MQQKQNKPIDPVVLVTFGVILTGIAVMLGFQAGSNNFANDSGITSQIIVAFVTGITTGGLSCLAVQGGLLASSLAHQIEQDYATQTTSKKKEKTNPKFNSAFPIFLFLSGRRGRRGVRRSATAPYSSPCVCNETRGKGATRRDCDPCRNHARDRLRHRAARHSPAARGAVGREHGASPDALRVGMSVAPHKQASDSGTSSGGDTDARTAAGCERAGSRSS